MDINEAMKTLGIISLENQQAIKKAYRTQAHRYHPDCVDEKERTEATERMKEINEAYRTIEQYVKQGSLGKSNFYEETRNSQSNFDRQLLEILLLSHESELTRLYALRGLLRKLGSRIGASDLILILVFHLQSVDSFLLYLITAGIGFAAFVMITYSMILKETIGEMISDYHGLCDVYQQVMKKTYDRRF